MKILFIGNSKTYRQNFPGIFKKLVEASGREIFIDKATKPGASLIDLYQEQEVLDKIKREKWDFVVIQERTIKALQDDITEFKQGATDICNEIINNNNETKIIYNSVGVYDDYNVEEYDTSSKHYEKIAELTNGVVCYSGTAYINFHHKFPNIELFEDRHHPTLVGAYLSACCLYNVIYNKPSVDVKYYDVLNNEIAVELQKVADEISIK
jgi:hypothetical protein